MTSTLLLADDSVTVQRVIELTFANEGVRVVAVGDGELALQRIQEDRPDIVLADVDMPKLDGYAVASHIKQSPALRDIPVLLLTGAFAPVDDERARQTGCDGILVKPFEPQQLVVRVKELLARRRSAEPWTSESSPEAAASAVSTPSGRVAPLTLLSKPEAVEHVLETEFNRLEAVLARPSRTFGDWDIPRNAADVPASTAFSIPRPDDASILAAPTPAPQTSRESIVAARPAPPALVKPLSVGTAFAALLAAEQAKPIASATATTPAISDAMVEEVVRRVLASMTEESVRRLVVDTAERVIRQEIERIKSSAP
jgi:CheY-like chemotaxis protein